MFKLAKIGVAVVLGLTFVLSIFCSGAFAESITRNDARVVLHRAVTFEQAPRTNEHWTATHGHRNTWQGSGWHHDCGQQANCQWHTGHSRCVRVVRWVGWRHAAHPVVSWVCRR